jgi:hypothetical protein
VREKRGRIRFFLHQGAVLSGTVVFLPFVPFPFGDMGARTKGGAGGAPGSDGHGPISRADLDGDTHDNQPDKMNWPEPV